MHDVYPATMRAQNEAFVSADFSVMVDQDHDMAVPFLSNATPVDQQITQPCACPRNLLQTISFGHYGRSPCAEKALVRITQGTEQLPGEV